MKKDLFVSERFLENPVEKFLFPPIATTVCAGEEGEG
jgi:hypothetical protein